MKIRSKSVGLFMIVIGLLALSGCNLPADSEGKLQTRIAETVAAENVEEPPVGTTEIQAPPEVLNPTLTVTLSPTITLISTLEVPMARVSHSTNCRTGPDKIYAKNGVLMVGEQAEVVGQTTNGGYWVIKNPDQAGECWLWGYYATVTGPTSGLPFYDPPPTPAFNWTGPWSVMIGPAEGGFHTSHTMNAAVTGRAFTGSIDFGGVVITYTGTISDDYLSVSGNWQEDVDETGSFKLYALGVNQFQGNYSDGGAFALCGVKFGFGFPPVPCYRP